jgi:ABC-type branched-subunit amino acid transport system permease subunit
MESGVAVVLLTEESLAIDRAGALAEELARQPAWSDLPVIILTRGGPESPVANKAMAGVPLLANLFHPDRWLLWLGVAFILCVYFFPTGIVGRLRERR